MVFGQRFSWEPWSEGTLWRGVIEAIWVFSFNTQYRASSNGSSCPLRLSYHLDLCLCVLVCVCERVCVHGWTGRGFYSLAALMLLEIRMLTQSLIWLHRSQPSQWNHINTNNVRYKLCSSLHPSLSFYICFSVSVDLNLNNQLSSRDFNKERVQSNEANGGRKISEAEGGLEDAEMRRDEMV